MFKIEPAMQMPVLKSGIAGILIYLMIDGLAEWLEKRQEERAKLCADTVKCSGLVGFLYLELIDASFSLDGVLGAFALSKDILIIAIGLSIGAMFVRNMFNQVNYNFNYAKGSVRDFYYENSYFIFSIFCKTSFIFLNLLM